MTKRKKSPTSDLTANDPLGLSPATPEPSGLDTPSDEAHQQADTMEPLRIAAMEEAAPVRRSRLERWLTWVPGWGQGAMIQSTSFWVFFLLILISGGALRTLRMDMPPFDFPADRQHSNYVVLETLRGGGSLQRSVWMELPILPWLAARTSFLCRLFDCQVWTLARLWSILFGTLTLALAALAGYWAASVPGAARARRRRLALFWMAALAFNPYHIALSRMIVTESVTLAMQMGAVAFFWIAYRRPRNLAFFAIFIAFFIMSGWAKIPSVIWLPGFFLYFVMHPATRGRAGRLGMVGAAAFAVGILAIFWIYKINPFKIVSEYEKAFPYLAQHMRLWMGSPLWTQTYLTRITMMLTLPGVVFALVGLLTAPWLFRLTFAVFLVAFYGLVNLNTYNFCHVLIPGTALAAWGANSFIEAASGETAATIFKDWNDGLERWQKRLNQAFGAALALFIVFWLFPASPYTVNDPRPRGDVLQAVEVFKKYVPQSTWVYHDDGDNSISTMYPQGENSFAGDKLDLRTGFYYLLERFTDRPLQYAGSAWVKWASLPGEPNGMLFTRPPAEPTAAQKSQFQAIPVTPAVPPAVPGAPPASPPAPVPPLEAVTCHMPGGAYDAAHRKLLVQPGKAVTFGITWKNPRHFPLAAMRWKAERWDQYVAVPLREGGFAISGGGVLCIPDGDPVTVFYAFEIPAGFPIGEYTVSFYPLSPGPWHEPGPDAQTLPFKIVCDSDSVPPATVERLFRELYPAHYDGPPWLWSDRWRYRDMRLEGYRIGGVTQTYFFSAPMRQPGAYELSIRGEAEPLEGHPDPQSLWPLVEVYLPYDLTQPVARIPINSRRTGDFKATFNAIRPFEGLMLKAIADTGAEPVLWREYFVPAKSGKQILNLRGVRLAPPRKLLPGLIESLNAPPAPKKETPAQATP